MDRTADRTRRRTAAPVLFTPSIRHCPRTPPRPASVELAVAGTEAMNQLRYEPVLKGIFTRVNLALVSPQSGRAIVKDLNPHLDYTTNSVSASERDKSLGDPRGVVWSSDGTRGY